MAGKVISVEVGNAYTKVCYLDYKAKNTRVYDSFVFETPDGTISDGYVKEDEAFCEEFSSRLAAAQMKERRIVFSISSTKIANREVELPLVSKDKILSMIKANASEYFPVDISNYHLDYTILEKIVTKEERKLKLLLLAVPLDLIETYFDLARDLGMSLVSLDYCGNSLVQMTKNLKRDAANISLHINENNTIISVMENGVLALQRTIAYGSDVAIDALMDIDKYRYDEEFTRQKALELLMSEQMINTVMPEREDTVYGMDEFSEDEQVRNQVTESFRYMLGNITRVIDYYLTKSTGAKIDTIYLSGIGAQYKGLSALFSFEIGSDVKTITSLPDVQYTPKDNLDTLSSMLTTIGAAKAPMGLMPDEFKSKKVQKQSLVVPVTVFAAGIAVSIALAAYANIAYSIEQAEVDKLNKQLTELEPINQVEQNYNDTSSIYQAVWNMYQYTESPNQNLVQFIGELEEKMPSSFVVSNFSSTTTTVTFDLSVDSKVSSAMVVQQLRTFDSISQITISSVTEGGNDDEVVGVMDEEGNLDFSTGETDDSTESKAVFTVTCTYKTISELNAEAETTSEAESSEEAAQ